MLEIKYFLYFFLLFKSIECNFNPADILPCNYHPISEIHCSGPEITDEVLKKVGPKLGTGQIRFLSISDTEITALPENWTQVIIENIYIERNEKLTRVSPKAFTTSPAIDSVIIRNNPLLSDPNVIELVKYLDPDDTIAISHTAIKEIPKNAFAVTEAHKSRLQHIYLDNNNLTTIGSNAFLGHSNLELISLNNNQLTNLDNDSLSLTFTTKPFVMVFLNDNKLNSKSFAKHVFGELQVSTMRIDLEDNRFTDFPETIFKSYLNFGGSQVFIYNNTVNCDCTTKWLIDSNHSKNVLGLYCQNLKKSFNGLTPTDLGCH